MGFFLGLFSSATFGLIPLFTLPLIHDGVSPASVLFYRFLIASLTLGGVLVLRRERFHASAIDLCKLAGMSFMYTAAALLLFYGLNYMPSGVATTIQFLYPVMVMLLMIAFFHEQFSMITACSIVLAVAGVALLSIGGDSSRPVTLLGVGMMLLSGFCNALYITGIHVAGIRNMNGLVMTFYVLFFGAAFAFANAVGTGTFQPLSSWWEFMMAALLAVITAVLSNLTLVLAVQRIGSTLTSVLGVMEPLTAVFVGILVFNEPFTPALVGGVILISSSVTLVMLGRQAGYFLIVACQRPDAKYFGDGIRDNFNFRVGLGRMSELGYGMLFGSDVKKQFFQKRIKGRGYCDVGTSVISEFYTPLVPKGYDFLGTIGKLAHIRQDGQVACGAKATGTD